MNPYRIPEGNQSWQFYHLNYARLLLLAHPHTREPIKSILETVERISGEKVEQALRQFLNHQRWSLKYGIDLVKPQCVIDEQKQFAATQSKDDAFEQHKERIKQTDEFISRLAS